jgi:hypothetical protein
MDSFSLSLEFIGPDDNCQVFRVAFHSSDDRYLLPYPEVTGLRFKPLSGCDAREFGCRFMIKKPRDEFVLNQFDRIAFDLRAFINLAPGIKQQWTIDLTAGAYLVDYCYSIGPKQARYDYLNKGSWFADSTKPWNGEIVSNAVQFRLG